MKLRTCESIFHLPRFSPIAPPTKAAEDGGEDALSSSHDGSVRQSSPQDDSTCKEQEKLSLKARMRKRLRKKKKRNGSFGQEAAANVESSLLSCSASSSSST